mgnify:CR=1 FL=1
MNEGVKMDSGISITDALNLLREYNKEFFLIYHGLSVEGGNEVVCRTTRIR